MKCLFCNADTTNSRSIEHIIPQSFGNSKMVLKRGIVCDKCNNYFSVEIENPFLSKDSSKMLRKELQIKSKKGNIPNVNDFPDDINKIRQISKNTFLFIDLDHNASEDAIQKTVQTFLEYNAIIDKEIVNKDSITCRLLAKMAIEYFVFYLNQSKDACDYVRTDPAFKSIIQFARYKPKMEWEYNVRRYYSINKFHEDQMFDEINWECDLLFTEEGEVYYVVIMFGIEYAINIGGPSIDGYKRWLEKYGNISPLYLSKEERKDNFMKYAQKAYSMEEYQQFLFLLDRDK